MSCGSHGGLLALFDDSAGAQPHHAIAARRESGVVRHKDKRGVAAGPLLENQVDDGGAGVRIQIARRFVGSQNQRIGGKRASQSDALLFPAGKLARIMRKTFPKTDGRQFFLRALESIAAPREFEGDRHILDGRHRGDELEGLEHDAYVSATEARQCIFVERGEVASIENDGAPVRPFKARECHQKCGFSGAGGTNKTNRFASRYLKADILENMNPRRAGAESEVDVVKLD